MISKIELRRIAHILDLFYKNRQPGEIKKYPRGYTPYLCISNSHLYDPDCLLEVHFWNKIEKADILKCVVEEIIQATRTVTDKWPVIYTRENHHSYEVIGYFDPKENTYVRYKIQDIQHVLKLLHIRKNKCRGWYLVAKYPDQSFLENREIQEEVMSHISQVQEEFPRCKYLERVENILPVKRKSRLRLV